MNSDSELRGAAELDDGKLLLVLQITEQEQLVKSASVYFDYDEADAYFAYDESDRLTREYRLGTAGRWGPAPWGLFGWGGADATYFDYAYDEAANRTRSGLGTRFVSPYCTYFKYEATYYEYANDDSLTKRWRADTGAGTYFEYDKTGSCEKIVSPGGVTYFEYTHANLVSRMVELGGSEFEFGYDGNLQRYAVVEDGTATYYLWDGLRLMETRNADYTLKARFAHGPARVEGIGTCVEVFAPAHPKDSQYYLVTDHRGSVCQVIRFKNNKKETVATRLYNAYGEIISETGTWPSEVPFGYQSNWLAPAGFTLPDGTQLYLTKTRVYVPPDGRFLQRDFLRYPNRYICFTNCPTTQVDPWGLQDENGEVEPPPGLDLPPPFEWPAGFRRDPFVRPPYPGQTVAKAEPPGLSMNRLKQSIRADEGFSKTKYPDSGGHSIGYGYYLGGKPEKQLREELAKAGVAPETVDKLMKKGGKITDGGEITRKQAEKLLARRGSASPHRWPDRQDSRD